MTTTFRNCGLKSISDSLCWFSPADLTGPELVDQQGASLRVLPSIEAVQLRGHLVQLFIGVVELGQELRVRPLRRTHGGDQYGWKVFTEKMTKGQDQQAF